MKSDQLRKAIGEIDDDLIENAEKSKKKKAKILFKKWLVFAAVFALVLAAVLVPLGIALRSNQPGTPTVTVTPDTADPSEGTATSGGENEVRRLILADPVLTERTVKEDLWKNGGLRVFTIKSTSGSAPKAKVSSVPMASRVQITEAFSFEGLENVTVESLLDDRYALVYVFNLPYFYDLKTGEKINLSERVLKERYIDGAKIGDRAAELVAAESPLLVSTEENRTFIRYAAYRLAGLDPSGTLYRRMQEMKAELDYTAVIEAGLASSREDDHFYRYSGFWSMIEPYVYRAIDDCIPDRNAVSRLTVYAVDGTTGRCVYTKSENLALLIGTQDGNELYVYDFATDSEKALGTIRSAERVQPTDFSFACGGRMLVVTEPVVSGINAEFHNDDDVISFPYRGEYISLFDLEKGESIANEKFDLIHEKVLLNGAGKGVLSPTGRVAGVRYFPMEAQTDMLCTYRAFADRFQYTDDGSGKWSFLRMGEDGEMYEIIIDGAFERFAADDTVVIMRQNGFYRAYSLIDLTETTYHFCKFYDLPGYKAADITSEIAEGRYFLYAHEYYRTVFENGVLKRVNYFTNEETTVYEDADLCVLSENGGFAFLWSQSNNAAFCFNIATLESCVVKPDAAFIEVLERSSGSALSILYNDAENALTLCFAKRHDPAEKAPSDFFDEVFEKIVLPPEPIDPPVQPTETSMTPAPTETTEPTEATEPAEPPAPTVTPLRTETPTPTKTPDSPVEPDYAKIQVIGGRLVIPADAVSEAPTVLFKRQDGPGYTSVENSEAVYRYIVSLLNGRESVPSAYNHMVLNSFTYLDQNVVTGYAIDLNDVHVTLRAGKELIGSFELTQQEKDRLYTLAGVREFTVEDYLTIHS